jgi:hypothetical protein
MASMPSWVWLAAGWCVIAPGAWLLLTGRRSWTRKRGRFCPRCEYDMQGTDGLQCPECGRVAGGEREMKRLPARKRWRLVGVSLLIVGWVLLQGPAFAAHGWAGGVPSWALVRWAPVKTDSADASTVRNWLFPPPPGYPALTQSPPPSKLTARFRSDAYLETWRRIHKAEMSEAETAGYLRRHFPVTAKDLLKWADMPDAWPSDWALPELNPVYDAFGSSLLRSAACRFVETTGSSTKIVSQVDLSDRTITLAETTIRLDRTVPGVRFMHPVDTPAARDEIVRALSPAVSIGIDRVRVEFTGRKQLTARDAPYVLPLRVRLLAGEKTLAAGTCAYERLSTLGHSPVFAYLQWEEGGLAFAQAHPEQLEVEITGLSSQGLMDYVMRSTKLRDVWGGTLRTKPRVLRDAE